MANITVSGKQKLSFVKKCKLLNLNHYFHIPCLTNECNVAGNSTVSAKHNRSPVRCHQWLVIGKIIVRINSQHLSNTILHRRNLSLKSAAIRDIFT